jgi:uncharacterized protein with PQ loop repeat
MSNALTVIVVPGLLDVITCVDLKNLSLTRLYPTIFCVSAIFIFVLYGRN